MNIISGLVAGQVLQRRGSKGANAFLTGTCAGSGVVHVSIYKGKTPLKGWKRRLAGMSFHGKFGLWLKSILVGGPYRLRLESGKEHVEIKDFFVGDVWVLAGQSNMEGCGNMTGRAKPHPLVRAFSMRREWRLATEPLHRLAESPDACHAAVQCSVAEGEKLRREAIKGVGVGLFFAREMLDRSGGVPQGLICTAHGGTSMQQWSPERKNLGGDSLYASMLMSVRATGQPVAGQLWYQGESDANPADAAVYTPRMKALVASTRRDLGLPRLPWIIVQLGKFFTEQVDPTSWNNIQEQQRRLPNKVKFLETVPAIDLSMDDHIHIGSAGFPRLAVRLASAADRLVYGNRHEAGSPQLLGVRVVSPMPHPALEVSFDQVVGDLHSGGEPFGFQMVSWDGVPLDWIFKVELKRNIAKLNLVQFPHGGFNLHYGRGFAPDCNVCDARGFSLPVFGPISIGAPKAVLPFATQWRLTEIIPAAKKLDRVAIAEVKALGTTPKSYPVQGFINEHDNWVGKAGQAFFHSRLELSEPMHLDFLMGYDGPFRLWLNEKPFFMNIKGTNPCFPDESVKAVRLPAGTHDIHVGMDLNEGRAWGFFLRFARRDVTKAQIKTGVFTKPVYRA